MFSPPTKVVAALERTVASHPYAISGRIAPGPRAESDARLVWQRLLRCEPARLDAVIESLSNLEVSLLIYGAQSRLSETRTLEVLKRLYPLRCPSSADRLAWQAFLLTDGAPEFEAASRRFLASENSPWQKIFSFARPQLKALDMYVTAKRKFADFFSQAVFPGWHAALNRQFKRALIHEPYLDRVIAKEAIGQIEIWLEEVCVDSERVDWFREYVERSVANRRAASDPVFNRIVARFGEPSQARPFWSSISPAAAAEFERWLRELKLTRALGEGDRLQFWRAYLDRMRSTYESRNGDAVFICFDKWFAVQFVQMGKATYMFGERHLPHFKRLDDITLYREVLNTNSIGRYEHRGHYWQYQARTVVNALLEVYG